MSKKILVIDDDRLVSRTLSRCLKNSGYSVAVALDGFEALEKAKESRFDLVITDIRMPGMSGLETLRRIRELWQERTTMVPAIVATGYAGDELHGLDDELGIVAHLHKPFEIDEFLKTIQENLDVTVKYQRRHPRVPQRFSLKIFCEKPDENGRIEIEGQTLTISEKGLSAQTGVKIPGGFELKAHIGFSSVYNPIDVKLELIWSEVSEEDKTYIYGFRLREIAEETALVLREIVRKYQGLSDRFILLTTHLHQFLTETKRVFDDFDMENTDEIKRIAFVRKHKERIYEKLTGYVNDIWEVVKNLSETRYVMHKDFCQQLLIPLLGWPEINRRIYEKPFGYPGDFIIMNYIYDYSDDEDYLGDSTYEKLMNNYTCNIPIARSNISRKYYLKEVLEQTIKQTETPRIMSIACGSTRELIELLEEGKVRKKLSFTCLDLDNRALEYIQSNIAIIEKEKTQHLDIKYIHKDIISIIKDKTFCEDISGNDLVYVAGLYDYFGDKMAKRLFCELYSLLNHRGRLVICNISKENSSHRAYYEMIGEWYMRYRTEEDMLQWIEGLEGATAEFAYPEGGAGYHFLVTTKT